MDKLRKVMEVFVQQELGNKITQFNMTGLLTVLESELKEEIYGGVNESADVPEVNAESTQQGFDGRTKS